MDTPNLKNKKHKKNIDQLDRESWILDKYIAKFGYTNEKYPENSLGAFSCAVEKGYTNLLQSKLRNQHLQFLKSLTDGHLDPEKYETFTRKIETKFEEYLQNN